MARTALQVWVADHRVTESTFERLGDARAAADRLRCGVGVFVAGPVAAVDVLGQRGADLVISAIKPLGIEGAVAAAMGVLRAHGPRLVLAGGDVHGRELAARLAAAGDWKLVTPALSVQVRGDVIEATGLDRSGRLSRQVRGEASETLVVTMRGGVAEALPPDPARTCTSEVIDAAPITERVHIERVIPADPASVDIRFADRLVAGGRGLGGKEGFDKLRDFARKLNAGVAASRMAVDLGWIEHERQVGQTGRTVRPDLYIACGISGASHHLEGIADVEHVVAINTDPQAPIFKAAHLGLVADLYEVLRLAEQEISGNPRIDNAGLPKAPSPQPSPGRGEYAAGRGSQT